MYLHPQTQKRVQSLQDQHRGLSGGDPPGFSITSQLNGTSALGDLDKFSTQATVSSYLEICHHFSLCCIGWYLAYKNQQSNPLYKLSWEHLL